MSARYSVVFDYVVECRPDGIQRRDHVLQRLAYLSLDITFAYNLAVRIEGYQARRSDKGTRAHHL